MNGAPPSLTVRDAQPADVDAFRALHDECLEVKYASSFYAALFAGSPSSLALVAVGNDGALLGACSTRVTPRVARRGAARWAGGFLVDAAHRAAAALFAVLTAHDDSDSGRADDDAAAQRVGYIMTLCVAASARRRGVARALLGSLLARLHPPGDPPPDDALACSSVELHMLETNAPALGLYASLGFTEERRIMGYYNFDGVPRNAILLRRVAGGAGPSSVEGAIGGAGGEGDADNADADADNAFVEGGWWSTWLSWLSPFHASGTVVAA